VVVCTAHPPHGLSALLPAWGFEKVSPEHNFFKTSYYFFNLSLPELGAPAFFDQLPLTFFF
jgi:hypothetical protein